MTALDGGRTRTTFDILLGIVLLLIGAAMITYSAIATSVSIAILSWVPIAAGVSLGIMGFFRREDQYWWVRVAGGVLLVILGIIFLIRPETTKITLTIIAGVYFTVSGALRVISSYRSTPNRLVLSIGGILSIVMGAVVLLSLRDSSSVTLSVLIGAEMVIEGITLALAGTDPSRVASSRRFASRFLDEEAPHSGGGAGRGPGGSGHGHGGGGRGGAPIYEPPEITRD